jgi:hypothetical protein
MVTEGDGGRTRFGGRVAAAIRDPHPSYFAFVMATGIISTGAFLLGPSWLSQALLVIASIGFVALAAAQREPRCGHRCPALGPLVTSGAWEP